MWTMLLVSDLSFDIVSVLPGQLFLSSSRDEDITISFQNVPLVWLRVGEAHNGTMLLQRKHKYIKKQFKYRNKGTFSPGNQKAIVNGLLTDQFVVLQLFGVHAVGVPDAAIDFSNSHTLGTITVEVTHGMQTHITKTLHDRIRN